MRQFAVAASIAFCAGTVQAQSNSSAAAIDAYLQSYVRSGNLAGDVLVEKNGKVVFEKAYGLADRERRAPSAAKLSTCTGSFRFGPDFYQPNATLKLTADGSELRLHWPSGYITAMIPVGRDHFIDRSYWVDVKIDCDASGHADSLSYDRFQGKAAGQK